MKKKQLKINRAITCLKSKKPKYKRINKILIVLIIISVFTCLKPSVSQNSSAEEDSYVINEVLQSAAYNFSQSDPTVQSSKVVLAEMYTATWCPPCAHADDAFDRLADEYPASKFTLLEYHPYPDNEDPFGTSKTSNRMSNYYGANSFPTTKFDGIIDESGGYDGIYDKYKNHIESGLQNESKIEIQIDGEINEDSGEVNTIISTNENLLKSTLIARLMVYEDHIYFEGSNGVTDHRFVVREVLEEKEIILNQSNVEINRVFQVSDDWNISRMGVIVFVQSEGEKTLDSTIAIKEVLQSAAFNFTNSEPTIQSSKAVLAEMYTATWCPPCAYADDAFDRLTDEYPASKFTLLEYHPYPDDEDPFGTTETSNRMSKYYGANIFPTVKFNGIFDESGGYNGIYDKYKSRLESELQKESKIEIIVGGEISDGSGTLNSIIKTEYDLSKIDLTARLMVYEDHIYFEGSNDVTDHRFVVRDVLEEKKITLNKNSIQIDRTLSIPDNWNTSRMGVVVFVQSESEIKENVKNSNKVKNDKKEEKEQNFKLEYIGGMIAIVAIPIVLYSGFRYHQLKGEFEKSKLRDSKNKSKKHPITHDEFVKCPKCGVSLKTSRLKSHLQRVHK